MRGDIHLYSSHCHPYYQLVVNKNCGTSPTPTPCHLIAVYYWSFGIRVLFVKMELNNLIKDKRFWFASILIAWAAGLQGHMMWLQRQDAFKQKFGKLDENTDQEIEI